MQAPSYGNEVTNTVNAGRFCCLGLIAAITLFFCPSLQAEPSLNSYAIYEEFGTPHYAVKIESQEPLEFAEDLFADDNPKNLSLKILADTVVQRQWCRFWTQNISINISSDQLENLADTILRVCDQLEGDLVKGDQIDFFRLSSAHTEFSMNGVELGILQGEGVFEAFLTPFFGDSPVNTEVKASLLSQEGDNTDAETTYRETNYSEARVATIESWIAPPEPEPSLEIDLAEEEIQLAEVNGKRPKSDERISELELYPLETLELEGKKREAQQNWSPVWDEDQLSVYETAGLLQEPVMASAAYRPTEMMFASTSDFNLEQMRPKDEQPRISILDIQDYQQQALRQVYALVEYPFIARRRGREGSLRLQIDIDTLGNIQEIRTLESSRYDELNQAAMAAIEQAAPFDSPPLEQGEETFELLLPIRFTLE